MDTQVHTGFKGARSSSAYSEPPHAAPEELSPFSEPGTWTPSQFKPNDFAGMRAAASGPTHTYGNANRKKHNVREYTLGEEIANSITHGLGIALAIAAIPILVIVALDGGGGTRLFAAIVYAITMVLEYTMSTLYHAIAVEKAKRIFKILDHSCIYLFIAGSYTPFCLVSLADSGGVWLCTFVWVVALVGVACEAFWVFRPRWISAALYLLLGWSVIWFLPALIEAIPGPGLWLLVGGGVCYTIGCIFYVLKKIPYMHSIFHLWVLAGSILQFFAIALYVL